MIIHYLNKFLALFCLASSRVKSEENVPNIDYAQTVLSLQEKLSRINSTKSPSPASESGLRISIVYPRLYNYDLLGTKIENVLCKKKEHFVFLFEAQKLPIFLSYKPKGFHGIQCDPNQKFLFKMAVPLKLCISDTIFVGKTKKR